MSVIFIVSVGLCIDIKLNWLIVVSVSAFDYNVFKQMSNASGSSKSRTAGRFWYHILLCSSFLLISILLLTPGGWTGKRIPRASLRNLASQKLAITTGLNCYHKGGNQVANWRSVGVPIKGAVSARMSLKQLRLPVGYSSSVLLIWRKNWYGLIQWTDAKNS